MLPTSPIATLLPHSSRAQLGLIVSFTRECSDVATTTTQDCENSDNGLCQVWGLEALKKRKKTGWVGEWG